MNTWSKSVTCVFDTKLQILKHLANETLCDFVSAHHYSGFYLDMIKTQL